MHGVAPLLADGSLDQLLNWLNVTWIIVKVIIGFTLIIFIHELGHFLAAKWTGVRVDRFAVGFGPRLIGYRKGEGVRLGTRPDYTAEELRNRNLGETDYCLNLLPLGGYVKMLGQEDIIIDDDTDEVRMGNDPRAFTNRPVRSRMIVASAGVVFNFIFAIMLMMLVFMIGLPMPTPQIGWVAPGMPAAKAGIRAGDMVRTIDGYEVDGFQEVQTATALAEGELHFGIERDGQRLELAVQPESPAPGQDPLIGIAPFTEPVLADSTEKLSMFGPPLEKDDRITAVDGVPAGSGSEVVHRVAAAEGRLVPLTIERRDPKTGTTAAVTANHRAWLFLMRDREVPRENPRVGDDRDHLLGLLPRSIVYTIEPGQPGAIAGLRAGDVVAAWGSIVHPRYGEIVESMRSVPGKPMLVTVERGGKPVELKVVPQLAESSQGTREMIGASFAREQDRLVVADVLPGTPAAAMNLPRGAELKSLNGAAVHTWPEVFAALRAAAGTPVKIGYRSGDNEAEATLAVPASIVDDAKLPSTAVILSIDGKRTAKLDDKDVALARSPVAVAALLKESIGSRVEIEYAADDNDPAPHKVSVLVTSENAYPWQMFAGYVYDLPFSAKMRNISAGGNPIIALKKGWRFTSMLIWQMWGTFKRVSTAREKATKNLSGPIGIAQIAYETGKTGLPQLLFFLAFLSANLAVVNFLPLPVLDGGLMMFLILEWIRGKRLSLKTQMISTMVGLAVIGICFIFVMYQDIMRLL